MWATPSSNRSPRPAAPGSLYSKGRYHHSFNIPPEPAGLNCFYWEKIKKGQEIESVNRKGESLLKKNSFY